MNPKRKNLDPKGYLPRLIRLVNSSELPHGMIATLDKGWNLVKVDRDWWEGATPSERNIIERVEAPYLEQADFVLASRYAA